MLGAAGIGALTIPGYLYYFGEVQYDGSLSQPHLLSLIWDFKAIKEIGDQYRMQVPEETNERSLVEALAVDGLSGETLESKLDGKVRSDFINGNTVLVDGWILSRTEARQCALFSSVQSKQ